MSYSAEHVSGARMETITNKETGDIAYVSRGVSIGKEPEELFEGKGDPVIQVSTLKSIVAEASTYDDFVAAINAL